LKNRGRNGCQEIALRVEKICGGALASVKEQHVADPLNSGSQDEMAVVAVRAVDVPEPAKRSKWYRWRKDGTSLVNYLLDSEVHTFAFSVAANAILSFIPFIVLLYTLDESVFHHSVMLKRVINDMVVYFLPSNQDFVATNLDKVAIAASLHGVQVFSLIMILVACTGIFLPLEVALNKAWGVTKSRNYLQNQVIAFGLAILMVVLGMSSIMLNAVARNLLTTLFFQHTDNFIFQGVCSLLLAVTTGVASILFFFSIYWLLPNRKVSPGPVFRTAFYTGIIWLASKYVFEAVLPHMDLKALYGQFFVSVGLLFWAYISGLILFAGAQFSVARLGDKKS
jgi:YihY family inner membrane protein